MVRGVVAFVIALLVAWIGLFFIAGFLELFSAQLVSGVGAEGVKQGSDYTMQGMHDRLIWGLVRGLVVFVVGSFIAAVAYYLRREALLGRRV